MPCQASFGWPFLATLPFFLRRLTIFYYVFTIMFWNTITMEKRPKAIVCVQVKSTVSPVCIFFTWFVVFFWWLGAFDSHSIEQDGSKRIIVVSG